jgi:hypothetical protein
MAKFGVVLFFLSASFVGYSVANPLDVESESSVATSSFVDFSFPVLQIPESRMFDNENNL